MSALGRNIAESGIILVPVIDADRKEFERALWTQGYNKARAAELAWTIGDNDAALQMLARHRITYDRPGPADWIDEHLTPDQRENLFACLHGVMCGNQVSEIPAAMERVISIFQRKGAF